MKNADIARIESYNKRTKIDEKLRVRYEMCLSEWAALIDMSKDNVSKGITLAYRFGVSRGYRAAKAEARRCL